MSFAPSKRIYKVVLLGDGGVGKTSLRHRYLGEGFKRNYMATIGSDFAVKKLDKEGSKIIQIWDLAGQQRFSVVRTGYYMGTKGALLVFDISRPDTFYNIPNWIDELIVSMDAEFVPPMVLVGNKSDLRYPGSNYITKDHAEEYAQQLSEWAEMHVPYVESSAKTGLNVDLLFSSLLSNIGKKEGARLYDHN